MNYANFNPAFSRFLSNTALLWLFLCCNMLNSFDKTSSSVVEFHKRRKHPVLSLYDVKRCFCSICAVSSKRLVLIFNEESSILLSTRYHIITQYPFSIYNLKHLNMNGYLYQMLIIIWFYIWQILAKMKRIGATGIMEIATTISLKKNVQKLVMNVEEINLNTEKF